MRFESLVSTLYDTYTSQSNKPFYAKIFVANKEFHFNKRRYIEGFLSMSDFVAIHYIHIHNPATKENHLIDRTDYTNHEVRENEIFIRAGPTHYHIPTLVKKESIEEKIMKYIFPKPTQEQNTSPFLQ